MLFKNKVCFFIICFLLIVFASCGGQQSQIATETETDEINETNNAITFENIGSLKEVGNIEAKDFDRFYLSNDEKIITLVGEKSLSQFNCETFALSNSYSYPPKSFRLDFSPDGKTLAQTYDNQNIELVNVQTGEKKEIKPKLGFFGGASFSPDGGRLIIQLEDVIGAAIWDIKEDKLFSKLSGFETAAPVYTTKLSDDSKTVLWISRGKIQLQDVATGKLSPAISHEDFIMAYALSPRGILATASAVTINNKQSTVISLFDGWTGKKTGEISTKDMASCICFSPDGSLLVYTVGDTLEAWSNGKTKTVFNAAGDEIKQVAFTKSGASLAFICPGSFVKILEAK